MRPAGVRGISIQSWTPKPEGIVSCPTVAGFDVHASIDAGQSVCDGQLERPGPLLPDFRKSVLAGRP